jgi:hypothetical protein
MENLSPEKPNAIPFDSLCIEHLKSTRKWTKFLSLIGIIFLIFLTIIIGLFFSQYFNHSGRLLVILPIVLLGLIYAFPIHCLWQFSAYSKIAIEYMDLGSLGKSMKFLKHFYAFMGILLIVTIVIYLIAGIGMFIRSSV